MAAWLPVIIIIVFVLNSRNATGDNCMMLGISDVIMIYLFLI